MYPTEDLDYWLHYLWGKAKVTHAYQKHEWIYFQETIVDMKDRLATMDEENQALKNMLTTLLGRTNN